MIIKANLKEAVRSLYSSKQRTLLALIGIVIGIGSVIAMVSIGKIVQEEALKQFKEMGTDILTIEKMSSMGPKDRIKLNDALRIPEFCPGTISSSPYIQGSGTVVFAGKKLQRAYPMGVTQSFPGLNKLIVQEGRFLSDLDRLSN